MFILSAAAGAGGTGTMLPSLAMIVVMIAVCYFLGDEITTIGGIIGTICAVKEKSLVLETGADRVRIEFAKWAVSSKGAQATEEAVPEKSGKKDKKDKKEDK